MRGVPRIKELLNVSKNIKAPSCVIFLKEGINKDINKVKLVLNDIETTYLRDIIVSSRIYYDKSDNTTTIEDDKEFLEMYNIFENEQCTKIDSPWLLRFEFNKTKMADLGITMLDINKILYNYYRNLLTCKYSDDNANKAIARIRINEDTDDMITELKALEQSIIDNITIKGIQGINKVMMRQEKIYRLSSEEIETTVKKEDLEIVNKFKTDEHSKTYNKEYKKFVSETEITLDTAGTNLLDILSYKDVDATRTFSNDIYEIYRVLGIEAARESLIYEINEVLKSEGVNHRHISLLVDCMTNRGHLLSIDRHGINRSDIGPLAKSSFEETSDMLIKGGIFSECDKMNGVSGSIMVGAIPPAGTGDVNIIMDEQILSNIEEEEELEEIDDEERERREKYCSAENLGFNIDLTGTSQNEVFDDIKINITK